MTAPILGGRVLPLQHARQVIKPSAATALAAATTLGRLALPFEDVGVLLTGGNIDIDVLADIISSIPHSAEA